MESPHSDALVWLCARGYSKKIESYRKEALVDTPHRDFAAMIAQERALSDILASSSSVPYYVKDFAEELVLELDLEDGSGVVDTMFLGKEITGYTFHYMSTYRRW